MLTPVPSTTTTRRPFNLEVSVFDPNRFAVCLNMAGRLDIFRFFPAWQYAAVDEEGKALDFIAAKACSLRTTSLHPPSASMTCVKNAQNVFSLLKNLRRLCKPDSDGTKYWFGIYLPKHSPN